MMPKYNEDEYRNTLRNTSVPAALWEQLQEINRQREELHAAILILVDEPSQAETLQLLNALERLTVQWQRMYWDAKAGIEALKSAPIADVLK